MEYYADIPRQRLLKKPAPVKRHPAVPYYIDLGLPFQLCLLYIICKTCQ